MDTILGAQPDNNSYFPKFLKAMNLSHRLLSSALLAGAVLSIASLPLTTLGSKSVTIQMEERPVFVGQLRELSSPYLALATGISLGVGAVSLAISSWRHAVHRLEQRETEIAVLKQQLDEKNTLVEQFRFSDARLQTSGLEQFLQAEETIALRPTPTLSSQPLRSTSPSSPRPSHPEIPQTVLNFDRSVVIPSKFSTAGLEFFLDEDDDMLDGVGSEQGLKQESPPEQSEPIAPISAQSVMPRSVRTLDYSETADFAIQPITEPVKIEAVSSLPAAQAFKGFVRSGSANGAASTTRLRPNHSVESSTQLNELLGYLKQVMTQIEHLQASQASGGRNGL